MKKVMIQLINLYQRTPGPWHNKCRYYPTCSEYFKISLERFGFFKGSYLGMKRILRCNPLGSSGYDPVPENKKKGVKK